MRYSAADYDESYALGEFTNLHHALEGATIPGRSYTWEELYLGGFIPGRSCAWEKLRAGRSYGTWEELHLGRVMHWEELHSGRSYTLGGATHWEEQHTGKSCALGGVTHWEKLRTYTWGSYVLREVEAPGTCYIWEVSCTHTGRSYIMGRATQWNKLRTGGSYALGGVTHREKLRTYTWEELCAGRSYGTWEKLHLGRVIHWEGLHTRRSYTLGQVTHWEELRTGRRELRTGKSCTPELSMERNKNRGELRITHSEELHKQTAKEETRKQIMLKTDLCSQTV